MVWFMYGRFLIYVGWIPSWIPWFILGLIPDLCELCSWIMQSVPDYLGRVPDLCRACSWLRCGQCFSFMWMGTVPNLCRLRGTQSKFCLFIFELTFTMFALHLIKSSEVTLIHFWLQASTHETNLFPKLFISRDDLILPLNLCLFLSCSGQMLGLTSFQLFSS